MIDITYIKQTHGLTFAKWLADLLNDALVCEDPITSEFFDTKAVIDGVHTSADQDDVIHVTLDDGSAFKLTIERAF